MIAFKSANRAGGAVTNFPPRSLRHTRADRPLPYAKQVEECGLHQVKGVRTLLLVGLVFVTGCATVLNGGPEPVRFETVPDSATVFVNGDRLGEAPVTGLLDPADNNIVRVVHEDCEPMTTALNSSTGVGWVAADILTGLLPVAVDAATGAWKGFEDTSPTLHLEGADCPAR